MICMVIEGRADAQDMYNSSLCLNEVLVTACYFDPSAGHSTMTIRSTINRKALKTDIYTILLMYEQLYCNTIPIDLFVSTYRTKHSTS